MRLLLFAASCLLASALCAEVVPIWSSTESEAIPAQRSYFNAVQAILPDGSAFMIAEAGGGFLAGTTRLDAMGAATFDQFSGSPGNGGSMHLEAILATSATRVVAQIQEPHYGVFVVLPRYYSAMFDADGRLLWTHPRNASAARILDNGDVLLATDRELMRVSGNDGALIWIRNLLDLDPDGYQVNFRLPRSIGTQFLLGASVSTLGGARTNTDLLSVNAATGETVWERRMEQDRYQSCNPLDLGDSAVFAWQVWEPQTNEAYVAIERRSAVDGTLLWSTRVDDVESADTDCLVDSGTAIVFSRPKQYESSVAVVMALSLDGTVLWKETLPEHRGTQLLAAEPGGVVITSEELLSLSESRTHIEHRQALNGLSDWAFPIITDRAVRIDLRYVADELRISHATANGGPGTLKLWRHDVHTGALIDYRQVDAVGKIEAPADIEFIDGVPYAIRSGLGADLRGLAFKRLDPATGAPVWTQTAELADVVQSMDFVDLSRAGNRVLARLGYHRPTPEADIQRVAWLQFDLSNGELIWQRNERAPTAVQWNRVGTEDGSVYVNFDQCLDPPACTHTEVRLARLNALDGSSQWEVLHYIDGSSTRGMDLLGHVGGPYATALVSASDGAQLWAQPMGPQEFFPTALALTGGDVAFKREFRSGSMRKVDVSRRLGANGNIVWTQRPGGPADAITGGVISTLPNGDLLLMARFIGDEADQAGLERPLLARMDIANGNLIWTQRPRAVGDRWRSVRAIPGATSTAQWALSRRELRQGQVSQDERRSLTTIALADGAIGAEHLYSRSYNTSLPSADQVDVSLMAISPDGNPLVENRSPDRHGLYLPRLEVWPTVGNNVGDVRLQVLDPASPQLGLGPSRMVEIEIENTATASVQDLRIGFLSQLDGVIAVLNSCVVVSGTGQCPALGSTLEHYATLGGSSMLRLGYEVHDPRYRPSGRDLYGSRGVFYVDTPFAYGDIELGNNIAEIWVNLGGVSNGFE